MVITLSFSLSKEGVSRVYFVKIWKWNQENVVLLDYMGKVNFGQYISERRSLRFNFRRECKASLCMPSPMYQQILTIEH